VILLPLYPALKIHVYNNPPNRIKKRAVLGHLS